jgi:CubicO group peptidase (beta-lactamase class C family)
LGITKYRWKFSPKGRAWLGGSAAMLPRDMAKIGQLCLDRGLWEGQRIVSQAWLEESTAPHVISEYGFPYGYLWWRGGQIIQGREIQAYWAQGNGGQIILVCPDFDMVAVFTGSNFNSVLAFQFAGMLIDYIIPAMMPPAKQTLFLSPDIEMLQKLPGTYRFGKFPLTITRKSNRLYASFLGETVPMNFQDRTHFIIPNPALGKMSGIVKKDQTGSYM